MSFRHRNVAFFNVKNLRIHYGGVWKPPSVWQPYTTANYVSGMVKELPEVNGDILNYLDLLEDISLLTSIPPGSLIQLEWLQKGLRLECENDHELLDMWNNMDVNEDGWCDIFVKWGSQPISSVTTTAPTNQGPEQLFQPSTSASKRKKRETSNCAEHMQLDCDDFDEFWYSGSESEYDGANSIASSEEVSLDYEDEIHGVRVGVDNVDAEDGYHNTHSSGDDGVDGYFGPPPSLEYEGFVQSHGNVYDGEHVVDDDTCDTKLEKGMEWSNGEECRRSLRKYAVLNRFSMCFVKNESYRVRAICKNGSCSWMCYCRKTSDRHTFRLRKIVKEHTCRGDPESRNSNANSQWVADVIEEQIHTHQKSYTPKIIQDEIWSRFQIKISYWTAWYARSKVMERVYGSYDLSYARAPEMCRQILISNPGSIATCSRDDLNQRFEGLCIAFKASIDGFLAGCRPILGLDGCFLKGKYGGVCLGIIALDGNNGLFPIAVYICRSENYVCWQRFLEIMAPHLNEHQSKLTFISDRQKGLIESVNTVFPHSNHRFCFRHMYKNFKNTFKGKLMMNLSWGAAKAYKVSEFNKWIDKLEKVDPKAKEWLMKEDVKCWARAHFDISGKCEHITNNFSESFNSWIVNLREKPISMFVEKLHLMIMTLLFDRKVKARNWDNDGLVPRVEKILEKLKGETNKYQVQGAEENMFCVLNNTGERWIVDLTKKTCSCISWQLSGVPCGHAVAVLQPRRLPWVEFCSHYHTVKTFKKVYQGHITPIADVNDWGKPTITILPPPLQRPPGRPRLARKRDEDEEEKKLRVHNKCRKCGFTGHNMRTCKGPPTLSQSSRGGTGRRGGSSGSRGGNGRGRVNNGRVGANSGRGVQQTMGRGRGTRLNTSMTSIGSSPTATEHSATPHTQPQPNQYQYGPSQQPIVQQSASQTVRWYYGGVQPTVTQSISPSQPTSTIVRPPPAMQGGLIGHGEASNSMTQGNIRLGPKYVLPSGLQIPQPPNPYARN